MIGTHLVDNELVSHTTRSAQGWVQRYEFTPSNKKHIDCQPTNNFDVNQRVPG